MSRCCRCDGILNRKEFSGKIIDSETTHYYHETCPSKYCVACFTIEVHQIERSSSHGKASTSSETETASGPGHPSASAGHIDPTPNHELMPRPLKTNQGRNVTAEVNCVLQCTQIWNGETNATRNGEGSALRPDRPDLVLAEVPKSAHEDKAIELTSKSVAVYVDESVKEASSPPERTSELNQVINSQWGDMQVPLGWACNRKIVAKMTNLDHSMLRELAVLYEYLDNLKFWPKSANIRPETLVANQALFGALFLDDPKSGQFKVEPPTQVNQLGARNLVAIQGMLTNYISEILANRVAPSTLSVWRTIVFRFSSFSTGAAFTTIRFFSEEPQSPVCLLSSPDDVIYYYQCPICPFQKNGMQTTGSSLPDSLVQLEEHFRRHLEGGGDLHIATGTLVTLTLFRRMLLIVIHEYRQYLLKVISKKHKKRK